MDIPTFIKNRFSNLIRNVEKQLSFQTEIKWKMLFIIGFMHIFGAYWSYHHAFPAKWQTVVFAIVLYFISGLGITAGVHKLWTHKSYKASLGLRIMLMLQFASAGQNAIYDWVRDHRVHHKFSDTEADPHNVNRGFWFAHIGWLMMKKNKQVLEKGRQIDMSDIENDPVAMFERKYSSLLSIIFCYILPTLNSVLLWGERWQCAVAWQCFIRVLAILHAEMTVNSLAHLYGYRPYNKNIKPSENLVVTILTAGEGGHNYHHTFPSDYRSAESFDCMGLSTAIIRLFAKMGLAYDLKEASPELINEVVKKHG